MYAIVYLNTGTPVPPSHNISARQKQRYRLQHRPLMPATITFLPRVLSVFLCRFRQRIRRALCKQPFVFNQFLWGKS